MRRSASVMDERVGFTVERAPTRKPLRWRAPLLLALLLIFTLGYLKSRPKAFMSGQYEGFIGYQYSDNKTHLKLRIVQQGAEISGDCLLTHQRGRTVLKQVGKLVGTVASDGFKAHASCDKGLGIQFEGQYVRKGSKGGEVQGTCYYISPQGKAADSVPFVGRFVSAWSPPDLLGTGKSK